jgi:metallo-beta-lactamase family protein
MCTGGRIIHHLRHNLWHKASGVLFVGHQAIGTLGRRIMGGADSVRIFGEDIAVGAQVWTTNRFSSHGDQPVLLNWIQKAASKHLILVHGEDETLPVFAAKIKSDLSMDAHIAKPGRLSSSRAS